MNLHLNASSDRRTERREHGAPGRWYVCGSTILPPTTRRQCIEAEVTTTLTRRLQFLSVHYAFLIGRIWFLGTDRHTRTVVVDVRAILPLLETLISPVGSKAVHSFENHGSHLLLE